MNKKAVRYLVICVAVAVAIVSSFVTWFIARNAGGKDKIYMSGEEYNMLIKFFDLGDVYDIIDEYSYKSVNDAQMLESAIKGMINALDDPYAAYYSAEDLAAYDYINQGSYLCHGMALQKQSAGEYAMVTSVIEKSAAANAGIKEGDFIESINGKDTFDLDIDIIVSLLRDSSSSYDLKIITAGEEKSVSLKSSASNTVSSKKLESGLGYIKVIEFSGNCASEFKSALSSLKSASGIIIDLRGNCGGYVEKMQECADMLLDTCTITTSENKSGEKTVISATEGKRYSGNIVVLINSTTTGAAEIFASALQENAGVQLVGEQTFGKAISQSIIEIPSTKAGIKLTTAVYLSPNGNPINERGITPNVEVSNEESDAQLAEAENILSK